MYEMPEEEQDRRVAEAARQEAERNAAMARQRQLMLAQAAQQTQQGQADVGISMEQIQKIFAENPDNPFVKKLASLMQGNPMLDRLAAQTPQDIERSMSEKYWGAPAKSKFGRVMQAIAKPIAMIGGAPGDFSAPAAKAFKDIQEMARRENRDDYLAAMAGSKSLLELLKVKGSAAKTAATTGISEQQIGAKTNAEILKNELADQGQSLLAKHRGDIVDLQKVRNDIAKFDSETKRGATEGGLSLREKELNLRQYLGELNAVARAAGGRGGGMSSQTSRAVQDVNGTWVMRPSSATVRTGDGGGGGKDLGTLLDVMSSLRDGKVPQGINSTPRAAIPPSEVKPSQTPVASATVTASPPKGAFRLTRTDTLTNKPWARIISTQPERVAQDFRQETNTHANVIQTNLENAISDLGMEKLGAALNKAQAVLNIAGLTSNTGDKSAQWRQITEEFSKMPGTSGLALKNVAQALGQLHSSVVKERSGTAASEPERKDIAGHLPNALDMVKPENFLVTINRFKAVNDVTQAARDLGLENVLPQLRGAMEDTINKYAYARTNAFKTNEAHKKANTQLIKLPELNPHELLWEAIQRSPDRDRIMSTFNLKAPANTAVEKLRGNFEKAAAERIDADILKARERYQKSKRGPQ